MAHCQLRCSAWSFASTLDPDINAAKTVPVVAARAGAPWDTIVFADDTGCGDTTRSFRVATGRTSGGFGDAQFHVVVD